LAAKFCLLGARCLLQTENGQNGLKNLFEVREMANSLYSLVLENNLGDKVKKSLGEPLEWWPWNCPSET